MNWLDWVLVVFFVFVVWPVTYGLWLGSDREAFRKLLDDNADNVGTWITQVAEGHGENKADPAKALDLLAKLAEFAAPKLGRVEHVGEGGGPVLNEIVIKVVDADRS